MKLILNAFSLNFVIGYSRFDIGDSSLKLIAMGASPARMVHNVRGEATKKTKSPIYIFSG